jgi:DNA-binding MarR family transcriptional regulator
MAEYELTESELQYLSAVAQNPDPVVTTMEVAGELDLTQQAVYNAFQNLEMEGLMQSKKVGSRSKVWWLTVQGRSVYAESVEEP